MEGKSGKLDANALLLKVLEGIRELHARTAEIEKRLDKLEASYSLEVEWHNRLLRDILSSREMVKKYCTAILNKIVILKRMLEEVMENERK